MVPIPLERYSIGDRTQGIKFNTRDGTLGEDNGDGKITQGTELGCPLRPPVGLGSTI
jgi:hypothetical protein